MGKNKSYVDMLMDKTIFAVDDDPDSLFFIAECFKTVNSKVVLLPNGQELLNQLNHETPSAILLDINMPVLGGFDTINALQENERFQHVPVIFISGATDEFNISTAFEKGATDYIKKPAMIKELLCRVAKAISNAHKLEQLISKQSELTRFNEAMVDREYRILELKKEINELHRQHGIKDKYNIPL